MIIERSTSLFFLLKCSIMRVGGRINFLPHFSAKTFVLLSFLPIASFQFCYSINIVLLVVTHSLQSLHVGAVTMAVCVVTSEFENGLCGSESP